MNSHETFGGISGQLDNSPKSPTRHIVSYKYDLHLVYLAFLEYFRDQNIVWEELPLAPYFASFEIFLAYSWTVVTIIDRKSGNPHIAVTHRSIKDFKSMILRKYPETYSVVPNIRDLVELVDPSERSFPNRVVISDHDSYSNLLATFPNNSFSACNPTISIPSFDPPTAFSAFRKRVKAGDCDEIRKLWNMKDRTFLVMNFRWSAEDDGICLEWGYAALSCSELNSLDCWPANPNKDHRKGHYIVAEYVDKVTNKDYPSYPWDYSFGKTQVVPKADLPKIIRDTIGTFAGANSEFLPNTLVVVAHSFGVTYKRLNMMNIELPYNVLTIDITSFELNLFRAGYRGEMFKFKSKKEFRVDSTSIYVEPKQERDPIKFISLKNLFLTLETHPVLPIPHHSNCKLDQIRKNPAGVQDGGVAPNVSQMGIPTALLNVNFLNPGNRSILCLYVFQSMLEPRGMEALKIVAKAETGYDPTRKSKL